MNVGEVQLDGATVVMRNRRKGTVFGRGPSSIERGVVNNRQVQKRRRDELELAEKLQ